MDSTLSTWIPPGFHLDSTWIPPGFHLELDNNLAGLPAKEIPHGLPGGIHFPCGICGVRPGIYGGV